MRSDRERLVDVCEALDRIARHVVPGRAAFDKDELIQVWIVHHLQIIGEACRALTADFCGRHPSIPWDKIIGMRNILVHHYFGIDTEAVWQAAAVDYPDLRRDIDAILESLSE